MDSCWRCIIFLASQRPNTFSLQIIDQILSLENFSCLFRFFDKSCIGFYNYFRPKNAIDRTHIYLKENFFLLKELHYLKGNYTVALVRKVKIKCFTVLFSKASQHGNMVEAHTDVTRIFVLSSIGVKEWDPIFLLPSEIGYGR